jgi:hypothetical protein
LIAAIFIKMLAAAAASIAVAVVNLWFFSRLATKKRGIAAIKVPLEPHRCAMRPQNPYSADRKSRGYRAVFDFFALARASSWFS